MVAAMAVSSSVFAGDDLEAQLKVLQESVAKLSAQIEENKKQNSAEIAAVKTDMAEKAKSFESTLLDVANSPVSWNGDMTVNIGTSGGKEAGVSYKNGMQSAIQGNLKFGYQVNPSTKVHATLSVVKPFGSSSAAPLVDSQAGYTPGDSTAYFKEFYAEAELLGSSLADQELWMRVGRLPTTEGVGREGILNMNARQSIYLSVMSDMPGEGVEFGTKLPDYDGWFKNNIFRVAATQIVKTDPMKGMTGRMMVDNAFVYGLIFETTPSFISDNSMFILGYMDASKLTNEMFNTNIGDYKNYSAYWQQKNVMGSGFSYNLSYTKTQTNSNGNTVNLGPITGNMAVPMTDGSGTLEVATAYYDFGKFRIGAEVNHGTGDLYVFNSPSINNPYDKFNTIGTATEVFAIYNINPNSFVRAGYLQINKDKMRPMLLDYTANVSDGSYDSYAYGMSYCIRF